MVVGLGWPAEGKAFQPHLTLGRVREGQRLPELAWGQPLEPLIIPVTAVHLIESQLRPAGPIYTTLHKSQLQG
jgi:2'-5' RNA ligase